MSKIKAGTKVPDFSLPMTGGGTWSLKDAAGRKLVIYFYPRDMTSGCTRESQDFRDLTPAFRKAGTDIVGISRDSITSHEKFAAREALPFPLLADTPGRRSANSSTSSRRKACTGENTWGWSAALFCWMAPGACSGSGAR